MKKHAFIISYPGEPGAKNYCAGVKEDIVNIKSYLTSPLGGYWYDTEISCIENTQKLWLKSALESYRGFDYLLIFFSGHGFSNGSDTILELSQGSEINERDLRNYANKQLIILDCCRVVAPALLLDHKMVKLAKSAGQSLNANECRKYYEESIMNCANTLTLCYGCQIGEFSTDHPVDGGYYVSSLLDSAQDKKSSVVIDLTKNYKIFDINTIHQEARNAVVLKSDQEQHPIIVRQKLESEFPFAILA
jgi:hypothetical protein